MISVEMRCGEDPRTLLGKTLHDGERPSIVPGNLVELVCRRCVRERRKNGERVARVLHRYDLTGELIETEVVPA